MSAGYAGSVGAGRWRVSGFRTRPTLGGSSSIGGHSDYGTAIAVDNPT